MPNTLFAASITLLNLSVTQFLNEVQALFMPCLIPSIIAEPTSLSLLQSTVASAIVLGQSLTSEFEIRDNLQFCVVRTIY